MTNIIHFRSKAQVSTEQNLRKFISLARDKVKLWEDLDGFDWAALSWPTHAGSIRFVNRANSSLHHTKAVHRRHSMSAPYIDFAKAYLRYSQSIQPTQTLKRTVAALQFLETALSKAENSADVTKISELHLDIAIEHLQKSGLKDRQGIALALSRIAHDLGKWHISSSSIKYWKQPFRDHESNANEEKRRTNAADKLPDDDALLAIAEVFSNGYSKKLDDEDVFITSLTCLLLSAPMRINESLHFRDNPLKTELDSSGKEQLYIAYWVPKNGKYVRKEVPEVMASHTKEAVRRLQKITEESRKLAKHYESGTNRFYRHANCPDVPDNQVLTREQVASALGMKGLGATESFLLSATGKYTLKGYTLNSLWQILLGIHKAKNPHFPYQVDPKNSSSGQPLKVSESLMCFRYQQLSTRNNSSPVLLAPMNRDYYAKRLNGAVMIRGNKEVSVSFFRKHVYHDLELRSHQLRHFLNTLAQEAGVSIESITQWSTRASKTQSRTYMHQESSKKSEAIAHRMGLTKDTTNNPVTEQEYRVMEHGPIITTRYGICTHDYTLTPCQKHADCLRCSELLMCKGHQRSIEAIESERNKVAENLAASNAAINAGKRVAGRWHEAHSKTLKRLDEILHVMTDPEIENGSPIQMSGEDFSHESRIANAQSGQHTSIGTSNKLSDTYSDDVASCLKILQEEEANA